MLGVPRVSDALAKSPPRALRGLRLPSLESAVRARYVAGVLALVGLYYAAAHLGYAFDFSGPVAAIVWLPVGVAIAFLYLGGLRFWPGVVIGDLLVNDYSTLPVGSALGQSLGNLIQVIVATMVLRRLHPDGHPLATVAGLVSVVVAIAAGTLLSATIGPLSLLLGNVIDGGQLAHVWRTWFFGDFSGALLVLPLALAWWRPLPPRPWPTARVIEAALMVATVVAMSQAALHTSRPLAYVMFPALIWAALRFGQRGATVAILTTAGITIWASTHYFGPFAYESVSRSVLETQLFIAAASLTTLAVAALVSERDQLTTRVRASRSRLVHAGDRERRRLERDLHDGAQQRLIALVAHLGRAGRLTSEAPAEAARVLERAQDEVVLAIDELRELAHGIHPSALRDFGLAAAVGGVVADGATPTPVVTLPGERLDDAAEATAYYVVLEAVRNAQKHAHATSIRVDGQLVPGWLNVTVRDDGIGGVTENGGFGLQSLRDRVEATGGSLRLDSVPGRGTLIRAAIPARVIAQPR